MYWLETRWSKQISCLAETTDDDYFTIDNKQYNNLSDIRSDSVIQMYGPPDKELSA